MCEYKVLTCSNTVDGGVCVFSAGDVRALAHGQVPAGARQLHVLLEEPPGSRQEAVVLLVAGHGGMPRGRDHCARALRPRGRAVSSARETYPRASELLFHAGRKICAEKGCLS